MIGFGVAAAWMAISIVGAKGLVLFARSAASGGRDLEPGSVGRLSGLECEEADWDRGWAHLYGARP